MLVHVNIGRIAIASCAGRPRIGRDFEDLLEALNPSDDVVFWSLVQAVLRHQTIELLFNDPTV
jgi:hypothetical protein